MRKMNCRILAATLLAVQIAVTAMPATALAAENDQIQETVQEQQVEAPAETTEEAPAVVAEAPAEEETPTKEEEAAPVEIEVPAEEPEEVVETQPQEESAVEVTEETETAEETKTPETEAATAEATENKEETKASEKPEEGKSFDQTVTVDNVKIKVTADAGAFEEGAKLSAVRIPSTQLKEVENAVADARAKDELVTSAYAFDIKIMSQDGRALQPAAGKKVKVSFAAEEAANNSLNAVVYHIVGPKDNIKAQKLATTVNREAKAAEAQTTGLSYYVVEFISKVSVDENADPDKSAKTETTDDTKTTGKTDPAPEDKNTKAETVTPAAKDTAKSNAETPAVKKETKTETRKSEVKKEKKSETKKTETVKKDKANSKKTEKAKTNSKKSPKTGDTSNMVIWISTSLLAVGGIVVLLLFRRRLR